MFRNQRLELQSGLAITTIMLSGVGTARRREVFAQDAIVGLSMTGAIANSLDLTMVE